MGSSIADQSADSTGSADSARENPLSHVVIVPRNDAGGNGSQGAGAIVVEAAEPPFFGEQHETVVTKQPPGSSSRVSFDPVVVNAALNSSELGTVLQGKTLGHFHLEEFVGGGGMGVVFRATDTRLGRTVAVKILSRDRTDEDTLRRFQNEAQSAARLDHENIARVYYVGEDQGFHFIVFEFIEGTNIRDLVQQKGPLPVEEAISYVLQVAEALEHASLRNVIHRDIKPSNILVTVEGRAKLVDMGLARLHHMESGADDLTASGVTLGTFDYISPEQARDPRTADVRSDLYSLGCTFYFMLTGRPPFPEGTVLQKLLSHSTEDPTDPRIFRPDLDEHIVQIVERLLAKQPARRYQRPSELIGHLLLLAQRLNLEAIARNGSIWMSPRRTASAMLERALPWALPIMLFAIIALVVNGLWSGSEPFEFDDTPVKLQPAEVAPTLIEHPADDPDATVAASHDADIGGTDAPPASDSIVDAEVVESSADANGTATVTPPSVASRREGGDAEAASEATVIARAGSTPIADPESTSGSEGAAETDVATSRVRDTKPAMEPSATAVTPGADSVIAKPLALDPTRAAPTVTKIVVSDQSEGWGSDVLAVPTLAEACRDARQLGAKRIELHFDGPRDELPLEITTRELTICSGNGFRPLLVFRPEVDPNSENGSAVIRASGSRLVWQNVQVLLDLTEAPSHEWALFCLESTVGLDLKDSVLTIRNVDNQGATLHPRVNFFVVEPRVASEADGEQATTPIPYHLSLTNSILRGQATVVRAEQATPFRLFVQNGLIATRNRLVEVDGARTKPSLKDGRVDVHLRHVTAVLGEGIVQMASDEQTPYQLDLHTDFDDSILYVTGSATPLFERMGVSQIDRVESRLDLRGRDNFYPGSTNLLRLGPDPHSTQTAEFDFDARDQIPFLEEKRPNFVLMWKGLPGPDVTEDRHLPAQYELDPSEFNPAVRMDGEPPVGAILGDLAVPLDPSLGPASDLSKVGTP